MCLKFVFVFSSWRNVSSKKPWYSFFFLFSKNRLLPLANVRARVFFLFFCQKQYSGVYY